MVHTLKTKPPEASAPATLEAAPATLGAGQRWRWRIIVASFLLAVALPTLVVAIYFTFFAANQYAAEARFSVRSATTTQAPNDLLGLISVAPAATITDAYVLIDFVRSRQLLDRLLESGFAGRVVPVNPRSKRLRASLVRASACPVSAMRSGVK